MSDTPETEKAREAFEAWHRYTAATCCDKCADNCPHEPWEWAAWQAGREQADRRIKGLEMLLRDIRHYLWTIGDDDIVDRIDRALESWK